MRVTVRVPVADNLDLLDARTRACLTFVVDGNPHVEPVRVRHVDGRFLAGMGQDSEQPAAGSDVVLLTDEGTLFFHLRAVYVRGEALPVDDRQGDGIRWFEVVPTNASAWDYGRMRAADAPV